jgi:hypothetical protein
MPPASRPCSPRASGEPPSGNCLHRRRPHGRGIAVVFAYAGHGVTIVDVKARDAAD